MAACKQHHGGSGAVVQTKKGQPRGPTLLVAQRGMPPRLIPPEPHRTRRASEILGLVRAAGPAETGTGRREAGARWGGAGGWRTPSWGWLRGTQPSSVPNPGGLARNDSKFRDVDGGQQSVVLGRWTNSAAARGGGHHGLAWPGKRPDDRSRGGRRSRRLRDRLGSPEIDGRLLQRGRRRMAPGSPGSNAGVLRVTGGVGDPRGQGQPAHSG